MKILPIDVHQVSEYNYESLPKKSKIYPNIIKNKMPQFVLKFVKDYYNNFYIKLSKKMLNYLEIKKNDYSVEDIKNAIIEKSENNKKSLLKDYVKTDYPKTAIYFDKKGKEIFNIKGNFISIDCLLDLIIHDHSLEIPDCHYFDYNKKPVEVKDLDFYE